MRDWWKVALTLLVVFALGAAAGHVLTTSSDAERREWQERTDSLLGEARFHYLNTLQALADSAAADSAAQAEALAETRRQLAIANAHREAADSSLGVADSLRNALQQSQTAADSIPVLLAESSALRATIASERAESDALRQSIADETHPAILAGARLAARLRQTIQTQADRIGVLEGQLAAAPKGERWSFELWGLDFDVGPTVSYTIDGDVELGVGLMVTP